MPLRYLSNVVTLLLDDERCSGCGMCVEVCPHGVLAIPNGKAQIIDRDACMECGACRRNCPSGAITVESGVGCVAAVLTGAVGRSNSNCGCTASPSCCE